jgi:threonine/homoserine/homoserine lactone efflux protein
MMDITGFLNGLLLGFSIAAPVGPIGVLCIKRTLASGRLVGFASGLGAATADAFYGLIAAFGLTFLSNFLLQQQLLFRMVGGMFLCYLGIRTFSARPADIKDHASQASLLGSYGSTLFLTLTNPLTILSFAAIYAGLGLIKIDRGYASAGIIVLGVFLGSAGWWFILSALTSLLRNRLTLTSLRWINRLSGLAIFGFGLAALISLFTL